MYPEIKHNAISEKEAIEKVGEELVEKVKSLNCDFTNRLIDDVFGVVEMSAYIDIDEGEYEGCTLTIFYLVAQDDVDNSGGDKGNCDYSRYTFVID
jgi:hypothetical protein